MELSENKMSRIYELESKLRRAPTRDEFDFKKA
jgi:hypothetical protein